MKIHLVAALAAAGLFAASAQAASGHPLDRCLVGTWNYASGGSADWMSRNIHQAHVTGISHNGLNITFRADGTFATGQVDIHASVASNNGNVTGTGHTVGQATGTWWAEGGAFTLVTAPSSVHTTVTVIVHGRPITVTPTMPTAPHATAYTCNATALITTQPIRGHEPIVTRYSRGH